MLASLRGEVLAMSGLKRLKHLDYAVYGNLIVPLLMFDADVWFQINDDSDVGKCRIECRPRKRK
ncbi:hypothetical protein [Paenibacillus arenilitoris]|uniref:Uncharacterized protein n=1 Tax=Paenibacillus arenilitoris TaxID=2772299 RepID=A0A927CPN8_9BACL|nr:hypothetical protein [Paenibacillus arenilitoris]MBD2870787.1 hypothetical protein [Paenibacillus arenilitoris]